jgi:hypothetical protein
MTTFARFFSVPALLAPMLALSGLALMPSVASAQYLAVGSPPAYGGGTLGGRPVSLNGMAGGPVELSRVDGSCRGYAMPQPSHVLNTSGGMIRLTTAGASGDTTMLVRLPDGRILCNDDGGEGFNPLIETSTSPGRVEVWVGSYSAGSNATYTLMGSAAGAAPPPVVGGGINVGPGMPDPAMASGRFGGPISASSLSSSCRGNISGAPNHVVNVTGYMPVIRFVVNGDADTTLIVQFPDGRFSCDDDGGGYPHPLVEGSSGPGTIRVWVGAYSAGTTGNYLIGVTSNRGVNAGNLSSWGSGVVVGPPPPPVGPPPPPVGPPPGVGAVRVDLDPRIPVTLYGLGVSPTVAVWSPRRGPTIEVSTAPRGSIITVSVSVGGVLQSVVDVPAEMVTSSIVTVTERADGRLLVRAERAPSARDAGSTMLWLLGYGASSGVSVAESWTGTASERGPRWSR